MSASIKKLLNLPFRLPLASLITLIIAFGLYFNRLTEFHFVDEINNIVVGYFILKGKILFSDVFFNHQMLSVDISYFIQALLHPSSLYKLMLYHRFFVFIFSFFMDILLIWRFKWKAVGFVLFFETFKYYLFGNLFLAESLIAQPLVYLLGVILEGVDKKTINFLDLILGSIFAWFILFMREPFIPLVIFLLVFLFFFKSTARKKLFSFLVFFMLSMFTFFSVNLRDYLFQVVTINRQTIFTLDVKQNQLIGVGSIKAFLYPLTVFFDKTFTFFRVISIYLSTNIILIGSYFIHKRKFLFQLGIIFVTLGLVNIRFVSSDTQFYAGFHMIPWFALFCFSFYFLLEKLYTLRKKIALIITGCSIAFFILLISLPSFYIHQKINIEENFTMNYGNYYSLGQVIKLLSAPKDTVFVEGYDTLIYWQADLQTAYKYSLYLPVMTSTPIYINAKKDMFNNQAPTFYYIDCGKAGKTNALPPRILKQYSQLIFDHKTICLYVKKNKLDNISKEQIDNLQKLGYSFRNK